MGKLLSAYIEATKMMLEWRKVARRTAEPQLKLFRSLDKRERDALEAGGLPGGNSVSRLSALCGLPDDMVVNSLNNFDLA